MSEDLSRYLADNLVQLRQLKNYSQQNLAQRSAVPRTSIANMESGVGNPSLKNLSRVAQALHVSLEELLAKPRPSCQLIKATDIPIRQQAQGSVIVHQLLPERIQGLEIIRLDLAPGARKVGKPHLPGTKEYLYGLAGAISVLVAGELYKVESGDLFAFPGNQAHSYLNREQQAARAMSVVVPLNQD